jgi:hypothetical protein
MRLFAFLAVVLFTFPILAGEPTDMPTVHAGTVTAKLIDRPSDDSLAKAETEVREVFKLEIEKAEKPEEKVARAEEFLKIAADTNDDEPTRLALLLLARKFAIEGRSLKTAADAAVAIASRYLPEDGEPTAAKKQFVKAQEYWRKASNERNDSEDQIELQTKAIEWYSRSNATNGKNSLSTIEKKLVDKRLSYAASGVRNILHSIMKMPVDSIFSRPAGVPVATAKKHGLQQVKILQAVWGAGNKTSDVTANVIKSLDIRQSVSVDTSLGSDPFPNKLKTLWIRYLDSNGNVAVASFYDTQTIVINNGRLQKQ